MQYKKDYRMLKMIVQDLKYNYGFEGLFHFTDFDNLQSIFQTKLLYSRNKCLSKKINFVDAADTNVINKTSDDIKNYVRFYYKEKTPTLYRNEGIKENNEPPHVPIPVYLVFDEELIYLEGTYFSDGNASSNYSSIGKDISFFINIDWQKVFDRGPIITNSNKEKFEIKRIRNAELLSIYPVPLRYLKKIIFRSEADYKRAQLMFGSCSLFTFDSSKFHNNNNYVKDYDIKYDRNNKKLIMIVKFNKPNVNLYKHKVVFKNNNFIVCENMIYYNNKEGLEWRIEFTINNSNFTTIEYYMNDILCFFEVI